MSMPAANLPTKTTLADLLQGMADAPQLPLCGIASDSRKVRDGYLFLALPGIASHGLDYLAKAIENGAVAAAYDAPSGPVDNDLPIPLLRIDGLALEVGEIANRWYGSPSMALDVVGVTGTNGKTTVAWLIAECLNRLDRRAAYAGTLGTGIGALTSGADLTTPAAVELHGKLAEFVADGASHAVLEVSSHALSQSRVDGIRFASALFTNLSRDHLDYHGDMRRYFESKMTLFTDCRPARSIIDVDTPYGQRLVKRCKGDVVEVSVAENCSGIARAHLTATEVAVNRDGCSVAVDGSWGRARFELPLVGRFNVSNALAVLGYLLSDGVSIEDATAALAAVAAPPGRMQRVPGSNVFIDYAHTPDALALALQALHEHCRGQLWCVFGCGGERDRGKRPLMGKAARQFADRVVLTSDNPRSEDPTAIIADILEGTGKTATVIEDRAAAIEWAVNAAAAGDAVLIAGKGHESYQLIGDRRIEFSDLDVATAAVRAKS